MGLIAGVFFASAESAQAQGQTYAKSNGSTVTMRKDTLEKVQWFKAPLQIQIVDSGPKVSDFRTAPQAETFTINLGPVGNGGGSASGASLPPGGLKLGNGPQVVPISHSGLPSAGFGSNINESRLKPGRLPSGKSTNLLAGQPVKQPVPAKAGPGNLLNGSRPVVASQPNQSILTYAKIPSSGAGSGKHTLTTSTSVTGVLKRGSLLK